MYYDWSSLSSSYLNNFYLFAQFVHQFNIAVDRYFIVFSYKLSEYKWIFNSLIFMICLCLLSMASRSSLAAQRLKNTAKSASYAGSTPFFSPHPPPSSETHFFISQALKHTITIHFIHFFHQPSTKNALLHLFISRALK